MHELADLVERFQPVKPFFDGLRLPARCRFHPLTVPHALQAIIHTPQPAPCGLHCATIDDVKTPRQAATGKQR
jgi:hypothetical protein